ncbi:MAG: alpha/beta hydrolase [bacterium]
MTSLTIPVEHGQLEAILKQPDDSPTGAALVCHPHPEHGGNMHNKVVYNTAKALRDLGFSVVRFNFRGVGASTGEYDQGLGELEDAESVYDWMKQRHPEVPFIIGGFSFGSFIGLSVAERKPDVDAAIGVGLPLEMYDFSFLHEFDRPTLLIQGEHDEFASFNELATFLTGKNKQITLRKIEGGDHFLKERYSSLKTVIMNWMSTGDGSALMKTNPSTSGRGLP